MIVDIGTWSDVYLKFDTDTLEYIINPNGDSLGMIAMGYNNTRKTQAQLALDHDGVETFVGRADFIGHYASFPFTLNMYGTITEPVKYKKYVDRDPVIFYTGLTTLAEVDLTEDPENPLQVYYDAPFNVDTGYIYAQTGFTERWYFTKGDYQVFSKEISFTDTDSNKTIPAGRTGTISVDVDFRENNGIIFDAVEINTFGEPRSSMSSMITLREDTYLTSVTDAVGVSNPWIQTLESDQPLYTINALGGKGVQKAQDQRDWMQRTVKSTDAMRTLTEFTIVVEFMHKDITGATAFEYELFYFNKLLRLRTDETNVNSRKYRVRVRPEGLTEQSTSSSAAFLFTDNDFTTAVISFNTTTGAVLYKDNKGNTLTFTSFAGRVAPYTVDKFFSDFSTTGGFRGTIHRSYVLPYYVGSDVDKLTEIFALTVTDFGAPIPAADGTTITQDSYPEITSDSFPIETVF